MKTPFHSPRLGAAAIAVAVVLAPLPGAPSAMAASPGPDGRIAYVGYAPDPHDPEAVYEAIMTANPDGSYPRVVPNAGSPGKTPDQPAWSPRYYRQLNQTKY